MYHEEHVDKHKIEVVGVVGEGAAAGGGGGPLAC